MPARILATLALLVALALPARAQAPDTIVVLDVSNSMWGQIDGVSKIEIARAVIGDLVADLPESTRIGLVAYGHREKANCGDIETVLPVAPLNASEFSAAVNALVPRGRTPLTDAVRHAAREMGYQDTPARIILLSDGLESCDADPCALAAELEASGIDFTAHVVGFDVAAIEDQSQLSCLAEITGGQYLTAANADELAAALQTVSEPVAEPEPAPLMQLVAVDSNGTPITSADIQWTLIDMASEDALLAGQRGTGVETTLADGRYLARAELNGQAGTLEFDYTQDGAAQRFEVVLSDAVTLEAESQVEPGAALPVTWTGPDATGDYIAISPAGGDVSAIDSYVRTQLGSPAEMVAPLVAGSYEIRYVSAVRGLVLASIPLTVTVGELRLEAADEVAAGTGFTVEWIGPNQAGDAIIMTPEGGQAASALAQARTSDGNPALLMAPDAPGNYMLHYLSNSGEVLISREIAVITPATLEAAPSVVAGANFDVQWTGPNTDNDFITIVPAGADDDENGNYTYTRDGNPGDLRAPDTAGAYELRYITGGERSVIATLPIIVTEAAETLEAAPVAPSGAEIKVTWTGPDNRNDFITVVPVGTPEGENDNYSYTRDGNPATLRLPEAEGAYEIRYLTGQDRKTLASLPITLQAVAVTLESDGMAVAGAEIEVIWSGPDNRNDFITIVAPDAPEGASDNYTYTREGNPLTVRSPDVPGTFEIRYLSGQDRKTLGSVLITLVADEATVSAPTSVVAGAEIEVVWEGPNNSNDYIAIVPVGAPESESGNYTYTREGSPLELLTPDFPGAYEIRYISGQSRSMRAMQPITLSQPSAALSVPPSAGTDSRVEVTWDGPDNRNDYIALVPAGADERESGNYTYTREGNPLQVRTPAEPGNYELRYISGQSRIVLATVGLRLTEVAVSMQIAGDLFAGAEASITFTGPARSGDYLTIVPEGSPAGTYVQFHYAEEGSPGTLTLPDVPGRYELRYVSGGTAETLSSQLIEVIAVDIYLDAPDSAAAGSMLSVLWDGPDNPQDYITIVPAGAAEGSYVDYFYTADNSPATLRVPETPGAYEIRYVSGQTGATMGTRPLTAE